jgi:threonine/homoserine/homoserine lactone efflux protein
MVSTDRFLAFAAMSLLVIVIPGPSVLFVIGRALAHGRRTAVATALGNVFGSYLLVWRSRSASARWWSDRSRSIWR